jgi:hypothetical protein
MPRSVSIQSFSVLLHLLAAALFLPLTLALSPAVYAATIPCATDSQGNPILFNTSTDDGSDPHPYSCTITTTVNSDGSEDVRIDQPVVDRDHFEYQPIVFSPSDLVTVTADGCVQTAGSGSTWKKYVNPSGSNSGPPNGFYFGSVLIKGAMLQPVPLNNLTQPGVNPPTPIFVPSIQEYPFASNIDLTLTYADDDHNDDGGNGYYDHDDGNNDQCANTDPNAPLGSYGGPAWVNLHIVHNAANPFGNTPPQNWDLVPNGLDANALASNPDWGWQVNGGFITNQGVYDASCFPNCTSQLTSTDSPDWGLFNSITHFLAGVCANHIISVPTGRHRNWFDVAYTGSVFWDSHSNPIVGDDDYNMRLVTPTLGHTDPAGTSFFNGAAIDNGDNFAVLLEFDSDETIDQFDQSLFWDVFHQTVDHQGDTAAGNIINGHDAVVIGLAGADEEHDGHIEIHPVHAIAIRESDPSSPNLAHDTWAFFVRNWGDEGECSSQQHYLDANQIAIQLTPPTPMFTPKATLTSSTQIFGTGTNGTHSFYSGPEGTFVIFNLPAGNQKGFAFGEVDLNWTGQAMALPGAFQMAPAPSQPWLETLEVDGPGDPEALLAIAWNSSSAAQQLTTQNLIRLLNPPTAPISSAPLAPQILTVAPQRPPAIPGISQELDTAKALRQTAQYQAFCAATGGNIPTQPGWCPNANFPPVTTLTTSGGAPVIGGWFTTPVTAMLTANDAGGSGIAFTQYGYDGQTWTNYTGPFILPDGVYTFYYRSQDNKGNLETTRQQAFKIDTRPPVITITQPVSGNYTHSSTLTLNYTVTDGPTSGLGAGSGVASVTPTMDGAATVGGQGLASGQTINLLTEMTLGSHTFTVNAVDNVGHAGSQSVTFMIIVTPDSIIDDVNQFVAAGLITQNPQSLLAKLDNARRKYVAGDCATAANMYQAFINELQAQSGKHVDATAAAIMIGDAQYLVMHCP